MYAFAPPFLSDRMVRSGPIFSNTGGVWYVTGSSLACGTPCPLSVKTCSSTGPGWSLTVAQPAAQRRQVVAVDRADVAEAQLLEEHAAGEQRLEAVADLVERLVGHAADERASRRAVAAAAAWSPGRSWSAGTVEVLGQAADARADRHLVVVEDDQQVLLQAAGVVERLEDDAATARRRRR